MGTRCIALLGLAISLLATPAGAQPEVPAGVVLRPNFGSGNNQFGGGKAFICHVPQLNVDLLLTAHHLFGPACGLERDYGWEEIKPVFKTIAGENEKGEVITSERNLPIPGAFGMEKRVCWGDIAAWYLPEDDKLPRLQLAAKPVKRGDIVFLYSHLVGEPKPRLFKALVVEANLEHLVYMFADDVYLPGTSGAPVLNRQGEVVGIHLGGGTADDVVIGLANPQPMVLNMLRGALKRERESTAKE